MHLSHQLWSHSQSRERLEAGDWGLSVFTCIKSDLFCLTMVNRKKGFRLKAPWCRRPRSPVLIPSMDYNSILLHTWLVWLLWTGCYFPPVWTGEEEEEKIISSTRWKVLVNQTRGSSSNHSGRPSFMFLVLRPPKPQKHKNNKQPKNPPNPKTKLEASRSL